jgi:hypothetical protein
MTKGTETQQKREEAGEVTFDPDAAPERVGVYERPQGQGGSRTTLVWILVALSLLALLVIVLVVLL